MSLKFSVLTATTLVLVGVPTGAARADDGHAGPTGTPDFFAPGIGDPYFPLDGNGGYDVRHYDLETVVTYDPASDVLTGIATVEAEATQDLSAFDLDLTVRSGGPFGSPSTATRRPGLAKVRS